MKFHYLFFILLFTASYTFGKQNSKDSLIYLSKKIVHKQSYYNTKLKKQDEKNLTIIHYYVKRSTDSLWIEIDQMGTNFENYIVGCEPAIKELRLYQRFGKRAKTYMTIAGIAFLPAACIGLIVTPIAWSAFAVPLAVGLINIRKAKKSDFRHVVDIYNSECLK